MRHQSNKRTFHNPHQKRHFQRGEGKFTDALKKVGKKTKDAVRIISSKGPHTRMSDLNLV